ncbi:MAG: hypothetical protein IPP22_08205 [Nitrosomonas sp.]|nr:hypothetical protein [Nitrosomonas sp.]
MKSQIGSGMEVADVQNLTILIVDPDGKGLQTHWQKPARHCWWVSFCMFFVQIASRRNPAILSTVDSMFP